MQLAQGSFQSDGVKGYSICGKFVGRGARWHYMLFKSGDLVRQWWPGQGVWGEAQEWTDEGWRVIHDSIPLFPAAETLQ